MNPLKLLAEGLSYLQSKFPVNRVVVLLTPLVFVPVAGYVTSWAAVHIPGLPAINPTEVTALFGTGAATALALGYKWIDGWIKHEQAEHGITLIELEAEIAAAKALVPAPVTTTTVKKPATRKKVAKV